MKSVEYSDLLDSVEMIEDWVFIKKAHHLDGARKIGSIIVPESVNTNIRESKVGIIKAAGGGHHGAKKFIPSNVQVDRFCYYTRYGKEQFEDNDKQSWVFTRGRGILAYIDMDGLGNIAKIHPRFDRLLVERMEDDRASETIQIVKGSDTVEDYKRYRKYKVLAVGEGEPLTPVTVSVGDIVYSSEANGVKVSYVRGSEVINLRLIPESECIACERR